MKTRRRESIRIFPFQLPLFWPAYCCWFPWHPAAILQLLILTNRKREGERGLSTPLWLFLFLSFLAQKHVVAPRQRVFSQHGADENEPLQSAHQQLWNYHVILFKPQLHGSIRGEASGARLTGASRRLYGRERCLLREVNT